jgi:hypothetical protein
LNFSDDISALGIRIVGDGAGVYNAKVCGFIFFHNLDAIKFQHFPEVLGFILVNFASQGKKRTGFWFFSHFSKGWGCFGLLLNNSNLL